MTLLLFGAATGWLWGRFARENRALDADIITFHAQRVVEAHRDEQGPRLTELDDAIKQLAHVLATRELGNR